MTKVLIVEDESFVRSMLANSLENLGYEVVAVKSAAEARSAADSFKPDIYCLDIELGQGASGLDLAHAIQWQDENAAFVFLTNIPEPKFATDKPNSVPRDSAYIYKPRLTDIADLAFAFESVLRKRVDARQRDDKNPDHPLKGLSKAQLEVMKMISLGMSNLEIADARDTSVRAVESLMNRAYKATGLDEQPGANIRVKLARLYIQVAGSAATKVPK